MEEYTCDLNATRSAIRAGYSTKTAEVLGSRLLTLPHVREAIEKAKEERSARVKVTADDVVVALASIGFANILNFMEIKADVAPRLDWSRLTREQAAAISEITVDECMDGDRTVRKVRFKLYDKRAALADLGKHLGLFVERVEHSGKVNLEAVRIIHMR